MEDGASSYRCFLDGDEAAFDTIMQTYRVGLIRFIQRIVGDEDTAEDIAIDVFVDLLVHRHRYNFRVSLKTYLYMLGRSRALDHVRRRGRVPMVPLEAAEALTDDGQPETALLTAERRRVLQNAMAQLPLLWQQAIYLVYFEGLSYEQTAQVLKKSRKQVDNLLVRAKKALRTIIGEEGAWLI